ncbi:uncharacterized protein LOC119667491 [Teleopsis dalmanni]|uniref:uncharacterized protein LOC119667491 n=1 Tax=Teleopsis dalmanni TaxID=139649 RepID=UPI0018CD0052|nr:uncharacterized protein LOC119667491 [Teleopsis dalmanni]
MEKSEFRVLIKHYFLHKKSITGTKERLDYRDLAPSISMIKKWFTEFRGGRTSTSDAERSGRPKEVITPEIVDKIHEMILDDRRMKVRPHLAKKKVLFHQDNARVHTCLVTLAKIHELGYGLLPHPTYSLATIFCFQA